MRTILPFLLLSYALGFAQSYDFKTKIDLDATPVISQGRTGTCWSFSSTSFLESEIMRISGKTIDISEMYTVRNTYPKKLENYILRQGKAQFSEGGLAHDVLNSISLDGLVPYQVFPGVQNPEEPHNHGELIAALQALAQTYVTNSSGSVHPKWRAATEAILDVYLGTKVEEFEYQGKRYTPKSFLAFTGIQPENYISITSFSHLPYQKTSVLTIPDNWSNGHFYNLSLDSFMQVIDQALEKGFTVELDCDVSEASFSSKNGIAVIPKNSKDIERAMTEIVPEKAIDQNFRQQEFENFNTTDDHLMHITGLAYDQKGNVYYKVKNSWGTDKNRTAFDGHVFFSESYMRLKSISITVHKDALSKEIAATLKL
ncbi:MAG: C1 family peptidase [Flavobacteriaceae bacterium]